jgi:hypothetical protein
MKTMKNDAATPRVIGTPRSKRMIFDSRRGECCRADSPEPGEAAALAVPGIGAAVPRARAAIAIPSAKGTPTARNIQIRRITQVGTQLCGSGTKARTSVASRGHTTPIRRRGHAAAAPTSAESHIFSRGLVGPKSATTAHPNRADVMVPSERLRSARRVWTTTMSVYLRGRKTATFWDGTFYVPK